jgi:hypothetical protein
MDLFMYWKELEKCLTNSYYLMVASSIPLFPLPSPHILLLSEDGNILIAPNKFWKGTRFLEFKLISVRPGKFSKPKFKSLAPSRVIS